MVSSPQASLRLTRSANCLDTSSIMKAARKYPMRRFRISLSGEQVAIAYSTEAGRAEAGVDSLPLAMRSGICRQMCQILPLCAGHQASTTSLEQAYRLTRRSSSVTVCWRRLRMPTVCSVALRGWRSFFCAGEPIAWRAGKASQRGRRLPGRLTAGKSRRITVGPHAGPLISLLWLGGCGLQISKTDASFRPVVDRDRRP